MTMLFSSLRHSPNELEGDPCFVRFRRKGWVLAQLWHSSCSVRFCARAVRFLSAFSAKRISLSLHFAAPSEGAL